VKKLRTSQSPTAVGPKMRQNQERSGAKIRMPVSRPRRNEQRAEGAEERWINVQA
jgi:hypothetical protein